MNEICVRKPPNGPNATPNMGDEILEIGTPAEWKDFIQSGLTMVRFEFVDKITDIPYEVDFVWNQKIKFSFFGAEGIYRAMYIIRPRYAVAWSMNSEIAGKWPVPFVVGVMFNKPGYAVIKMDFVTFLESTEEIGNPPFNPVKISEKDGRTTWIDPDDVAAVSHRSASLETSTIFLNSGDSIPINDIPIDEIIDKLKNK